MSTQQITGALPIAVKLLCDRLDIELRFGGNTAKTNGKVMWLPHLPVQSRAAEILAFGYVLHEDGHIRFTNFAVGAREKGIRNWMENILEDIRIEKMMWAVYAGAKNTLNKLIVKLVEDGKMGTKPKSMEPANLLLGYMLKRLRSTVLEQSVLEPSAIEAEAYLRSVLPEDLVDRMTAKMFTVKQAKSTEDVVQLADELLKMLQDAQQSQSQQDDQSSDSQDSGNEEDSEHGDDDAGAQNSGGKPEGDDSNADGESEGGESSSSANAQGDESESGDSAESGADSPAAGDGADDNDVQSQQGLQGKGAPNKEEPGEGSASADNASGSGQDSNGSDKGQATQDQIDAVTAILEAAESDEVTDLGDLLAEVMQGVVNEERDWNEPVMPVPMVAPATGGNLDAMMSKTRAATNALRYRIGTLIEAETRCHHYAASSGNRLNVRRAFFSKTGKTKVFDRRTEGLKVDTAFMLLLDRSTSMAGMLALAAESSLALLYSLASVDGVKAAAAAFPAPGPTTGAMGYSEDVAILTSFDERVSATAARYAALQTYGCTPLQNALLWAQYELLKVRASRRILMIATDGQPDNIAGAKQVLEIGDQSGIETLGLGIKFDISHLIPDSRKIESIEEMPHAVFSMMEKKIVRLAA